jgi:hypothetical protein
MGNSERRVHAQHTARRRGLGLEHASGGTATEDEECVVAAAGALGFD